MDLESRGIGSENKDADQLRGYRVFAYAKCLFSHDVAQIALKTMTQISAFVFRCLDIISLVSIHPKCLTLEKTPKKCFLAMELK